MTDQNVRSISLGLSQKGVRNHNERLLLTLLQRNGDLPGSDLARMSSLSPPTVSAILRRLETEGLLERGEPTKGKVGKPSIPMRLAADAVFSFGLKIGRRSAELVLIDFLGRIRHRLQSTYGFPLPDPVFAFLAEGIAQITGELTAAQAARITGIGVAAPFEIWNWHDLTGANAETLRSWADIDVRARIAQFSPLPVARVNDATAACQAEHVYGRGKEFRDYAYFFVGTFVGGGIVLNNSVFEGRQGNAGALGSMRAVGNHGESAQLVDMASIHLLEKRLREVDLDPRQLWTNADSWSELSRYVDPWLGQTAQELAKASLSTCSVIDFEAILIDGAFPAHIREELAERVQRYLGNQDTRGLIPPKIVPGSIGKDARSIGAASRPVFSEFLLNTNDGLAVA